MFKMFKGARLTLFVFITELFLMEIMGNERKSRIVNGSLVQDRNDFPFQVSIRVNSRHICGGSIIHKRFILTAAHCLYNAAHQLIPIEHVSIVVGDLKILEPTNSTVERKVWKRHQHARYFSLLLHNDIALFEIEKPLTWTPAIQPISLSETFPQPGIICRSSGWGITDTETKVLAASPDLMEIEIEIMQQEDCLISFGMLLFEKTKICGYNPVGCLNMGDSGGPLVCNNKLSGIVSFGTAHLCTKAANGFTSIQFHYNWIQYIIKISEQNAQ